MKQGGRIAAAIEVLEAMRTTHRPAGLALKDWGVTHRFAGSRDRAAIGNLVYDVLRSQASLSARMQDDSPRAQVLAACVHLWGETPESLNASFTDDRFAPEPPTEAEIDALRRPVPDDAPDWVKADVPQWLWPAFEAAFADGAIAEGQAMTARAPLDLRANSLKADRARVLKALDRFHPGKTAHAPLGLRIEAGEGAERLPHVQAELGFAKGWFEVQDEGSQLAALCVQAGPGDQVLDYCAGGGGKTLALAAEMHNKGQLFAHDADRHRMTDLWPRLQRAGVRNTQIIMPGNPAELEALEGRMHRVLIDAPCTGTGTWRRNPDAKWRLSAEALESRIAEQDAILAEAERYVRPGGRLVYVTCSLLPAENEQRIAAFLAEHADFTLLAPDAVWLEGIGTTLPDGFSVPVGDARTVMGAAIRLTPHRAGTDGFFVAVMERAAS